MRYINRGKTMSIGQLKREERSNFWRNVWKYRIKSYRVIVTSTIMEDLSNVVPFHNKDNFLKERKS